MLKSRSAALGLAFALAVGAAGSVLAANEQNALTASSAATVGVTDMLQDFNTATRPPGRTGAPMAYDQITSQLLFFGGRNASGPLSDTWAWTGSDFAQLSPGHSPAARSGASMELNEATGQLLLFGGNDGTHDLSDTWEWTGSDWLQLLPVHSPSARSNALLAFDGSTNQLVLFGGSAAGTNLADTWVWTGADWEQLTPVHSPSPRAFASMAFNPPTSQLILFGGDDGTNDLSDTWNWTGTDWSELFPAHTTMIGKWAASMAFDPVTSQLIRQGGRFRTVPSQGLGIGIADAGDTTAWTGTDWSPVILAGSANTSYDPMRFDPATGQMVILAEKQPTECCYNPVNVNFMVRGQTLSFPRISSKLLGEASFTLSASASSGLPVEFETRDTEQICSVTGNIVTLKAAGTCIVRATQSGDTRFATIGYCQYGPYCGMMRQFSIAVSRPPTAPIITSVTPVGAGVGMTVRIYGKNFSGATDVKFNGTPASFVVKSSRIISATVPAGATSGVISVTQDFAASSPSSFSVIPSPSISSFTPTSFGVGAMVTINGAGFNGATNVTLNGKKARVFRVESPTRIVVQVPRGTTNGLIAVTTPGGTASSESNFTVSAAPRITAFDPVTGGVGTVVTITGTGFDQASALSVGGQPATFDVVSPTQIVAAVPPGATSGKISVTTPGGIATRSKFKVTPPPAIADITPSSGVVGITVKITGSNFTNTTSVAFNGRPAQSFQVISSRLIKAVVPANATTGAISVTAPAGTGTSGTAKPFVIPCIATTPAAICKAENFALPPGAATPAGILFDGTNIWTANYTTTNVTRINPNNGEATNIALPVGASSPYGIAFDGTNVWTTNNGNYTVNRTNSVSGLSTILSLPAGTESPYGIAFDGTSIWTSNYSTSTVTRLDRATGIGINFSLPAGDVGPTGITFDGANIWTANINSGNVTRINSTTGAATSFALPTGANVSSIGVAFDGINIWTANWDTANITRIDPFTGLGTNYPLPPGAVYPVALAFDGTYVWTANLGSSNISRIDPVTGAGVNVALPSGAVGPRAIVFDGAHLWTANQTSGNVTRLTL